MSEEFKEKLASMKKAPRRGNRKYMGVGLYVVEVLSTQRKMGWNATFTVRDKELFICEFRIVASNNPDHEPGSTGSWTCKDPTAEKGGAGDVKAFAMALSGIEPSSVKDSDEKAQEQAALLAYALMGYKEAFDELNKGLPAPAYKDGFQAGLRVSLETKLTKTKAGGDFTIHTWYPAPDVLPSTASAA